MLNLTTVKTPGVYIDEVPKFPPSIAAVETAIPAFIGYTQFAQNLSPDDLKYKPTKISSLADFELYFGIAAPVVITAVDLDATYKFLSATLSSQFYMYDSVSMFYANGGGDCYIVSIGYYTETPVKKVFTDAIDELEKYEEPTIILFPDATLLADTGLYDVQTATLLHCENMKNRIGLFDTARTDYQGDSLRNNIGINSLKYGAAYAPWINVALNKNVGFQQIYNSIKVAGTAKPISALSNDLTISKSIAQLQKLVADSTTIPPIFATITTTFNGLQLTFQAAASADKLKNLTPIADFLYSLANSLNGVATNTTYSDTVTTGAQNAINGITQTLMDLEDNEAEIFKKWPAYKVSTKLATAPLLKTINDHVPVASSNIPSTFTDDDAYNFVAGEFQDKFITINKFIQALLVDAIPQGLQSQSDALSSGFPVYKNILNGINNTPTALPPSGAIAGIYAFTDNNRGVWKAPANVSLNGGATPDHIYTATQLNNLNVDVLSGKSINAIRAFVGKGTLVYGARTLAGNDNEWRYISVRRFFCMVEDSVRYATQQFVFEPNDANTWVRAQSMIENFLTTLWRQGALQGATTDKAFYVSVGLGKTMTSLDILEGRMIIEIGMAAVRPAEFIILRFSHIMAQA
ncbi:phage tail sheath family protein [Chitinophaga sp. Cy-1792]|uniref:phage tail sheath family protein n=1 Tax=Chitinophaga sp. Cy-1792 TaxID=2608339 RepID=UPI001422BBE5|nr:phage tail sheath family protein [Chitinophaga sp. Cy-1792]NIG53830.1 phage tail sheath family protein [Chitinophaga sp. Cy-1792]